MTQRNTPIITGWVAYYSQLHNIDVESECIKKPQNQVIDIL